MKSEYKKNECRICKKMTQQFFNIAFERTYVCENCEANIVMQSITDKYSDK